MRKTLILTAMMLLGAVHNVNAQSETNDGGTLIIPAVYDKIEMGLNGFFVVTKGKKQGVIDSNGKIIVPIQYDFVEMGDERKDCGGLIVVSNEIEKQSDFDRDRIYGLFNIEGVQLAPMDKYDYIGITHGYVGYEGLAKVSILERIYNDTLTEVYEDGTFRNEVIKRRYTKDGVVLKDGTLLTSYDSFSIGKGGLIVVGKDGNKGVLNKNGRVIIPIKYEEVYLSNGLIEVATPYENGGRKYGVFNNKGEVVIPVGKFESIVINDSYIVVKKGGKKGILNQKGVVIVPIGLYKDCSVSECNEGNMYYIKINNNRDGAVNDNGKVFIPIGKYESFTVLNKKNALVKLNGKYGIVDINGAMVVQIGKYDNLRYEYGVLIYSQKGKYGVLDEKGNQATPAEYDHIDPARHSTGMALVEKDGKVGVVNSEGKLIVPLGDYSGGAMYGDVGIMTSDDGTLLFNRSGRILAPLGTYEKCRQKYGYLEGYAINKWPLPLNPINSENGFYRFESKGKYGIVKLW